jgi:hypothetical protein
MLIISQTTFAEPSDFELEIQSYQTNRNRDKFSTKESFVELAGVTYRRIEYQSKYYYLRTIQPNDPVQSFEVICNGANPVPKEQPSRIYTEVKLFERSSLFVEALTVSCSGQILQSLKIGFTLPDSPKDIFTNKKILLFPGPGFYGEF